MKLPTEFKQEIPDKATLLKAALFREHSINTVCVSARCPNLTYCFKDGQATFMILGNICTRTCFFCAVDKGKKPLLPDNDEPGRIASIAKYLGLNYVVITSVSRDDLVDAGAAHFVKTIGSLREALPQAKVELLIPDFKDKEGALELVIESMPVVLGHNLETVPALYAQVRPQADYHYSLRILEKIKILTPKIFTKSSLMLGMGEKESQVLEALKDLQRTGCDILTLGQYLSPSAKHYPVKEFISREKFDFYRDIALTLGFKAVLSGPLVRSSYRAEEVYNQCVKH